MKPLQGEGVVYSHRRYDKTHRGCSVQVYKIEEIAERDHFLFCLVDRSSGSHEHGKTSVPTALTSRIRRPSASFATTLSG